MPISNQEINILIVEDNPGDFLLIDEYIREQFILPGISQATTLTQAKKYLAANTFTVILLDLSLPDSAGEDLVTEMVRSAGAVPIIVLTGYSDKDFGIRTLSMGVSDYLLKDELIASQLYKSITYSIERKRINIQLNKSEENYRHLFNLSPLPQWVYDVETFRFLDVNEAAIRHYGYSADEFLSMKIQDIRPEKDIKILEEIIASSVKPGHFNLSTVNHLTKSGKLIFVNVEGNSINFDGRDARIVLVVDVTENVLAEEALRASEQRFKALVQEGADMIGILDTEGNYTYVSPNTKSILDLEPEKLIGQNVFNYVFTDDLNRINTQFAMLAHNKRIELGPFRFRDGSDHYRWIESIITDLRDDPAVAGIVSNSRDVTQRILNENKARESIERYNTVARATSDVIYEWDLATNIVIWNKGTKEVFGHKNINRAKYEWWFNHVHPDDVKSIVNEVQTIIRKKRNKWEGEYRFCDADGNYRNILDRGSFIYDNGQPVKLIGAMQDITERINYIHAIEKQNERLKEIAWIQSHIVRAPLSRIMGLIDLLINYPDEKSSPELLGYIATSAYELDEVIRSIVNRTEEETGNASL